MINQKEKNINRKFNKLKTLKMDSESLRSLFQCPVCSDYAVPPVYQCSNGHIVCEDCRGRLFNCPMCREDFHDSIVNLTLAKVSENLKFPCKFKEDGCTEMLSSEEKRQHEKIDCQHMLVKCPAPQADCEYESDMKNMKKHLTAHHSNIPTINGDNIEFGIQKEDGEENLWAFKLQTEEQLFLAVFEIRDRKLTGILRAFCPKREAYKYATQIAIKNRHNVYGWRSRCKSLNEDHESIRRSGECMIMDPAHVRVFEENEMFTIKVKIEKKE